MGQSIYDSTVAYILENQNRFYRIVVNESLQLLRDRKRELPSTDGGVFDRPYTEPAYDREREVYEAVKKLPEP